jgi:tetratricopeptide (TPR) repeat protein
VADFSMALMVSPNYAPALSGRGYAREQLEKYPEALADYEQAIAVEPGIDFYYSNRGRLFGKMKRYDEAIADFNKALSLSPGKDMYYSDLGWMGLGKLDFAGAAANFRKCVKSDPKNFDALLGLAIAYFHLGEMNKVTSTMRLAVGAEPRLAEGMAGLEKIEKEGYFYTAENKQDLQKIFEIVRR